MDTISLHLGGMRVSDPIASRLSLAAIHDNKTRSLKMFNFMSTAEKMEKKRKRRRTYLKQIEAFATHFQTFSHHFQV